MSGTTVKGWKIIDKDANQTGRVVLSERGKNLFILAQLPSSAEVRLEVKNYRPGSAINDESHIESAIVGKYFLSAVTQALVPMFSYANGSRAWQEQLRLAGYRVLRLTKKDAQGGSQTCQT